MTTAEKTTAAPAAGVTSEITITLSKEVLGKLSTQVAFKTAADVRALVADAINTYVQIGNLRASDVGIFAKQGEDGDLVRLRFPFDPTPDALIAPTDETPGA